MRRSRACAGCSRARPDGFARAAARSRGESGRAWCRRSTSRRGSSTPRSRQKASVSSRQSGSSGRTTPSSRRGLIPVVVPARREPVEDRLDLVARRVAGGAQRAGPLRVADVPQPGLAEPAPGGPHDLGAERLGAEARVRVGLLAAQPVVDVERARPGSRARAARAAGRSSRRRPRRGREPRRPARSARGAGCEPRSAPARPRVKSASPVAARRASAPATAVAPRARPR